MNLVYPVVSKSRKLSQGFGEHPSWYSKFGMDGHNGIDFPVYFTDVIAADNGKVLWVKSDDDGFGLHCKITHEHGWTLYAHLSICDVSAGDIVERGNIIGLSGDTGNSTGPHLHFGYKPKDNDPNNGFYGYVDPTPFLSEDYWNQSIFGVYLLDGINMEKAFEDVVRLKPRAIVVNFAGSNENQIDTLRQMMDAVPTMHVVGRLYKADGEYSENIARDPEGYAQQIMDELQMTSWFPMVDSVMTHNEVLHDGHWYSKDIRTPKLKLKSRFDIEMMNLIRGKFNTKMQQIKYHALVSSRGTPDIDYNGDRWPTPFHEWEIYFPALRKAVFEDHFIDLHQYGYDSPLQDASWFGMRFELRVLPWLQREHPNTYKEMLNKRCVFISESPWDNGMKQGWLSPTGPQTTEIAYDQLAAYAKELQVYYDQGITFGHVLFAYGSVGGWENFDVTRRRNSPKRLIDIMIEKKGYGIEPKPPGYLGPPIAPGDDDDDNDNKPNDTFRRVSFDLRDAGVKIQKLHEREDFDPSKLSPDDTVRVVLDVFPTRDGKWENDGAKYSCPEWANKRYLMDWNGSCTYRSAGGATHVHFGVLDNVPNGKVTCEDMHLSAIGFVLYNKDGLKVYRNTEDKTGWNNIFMDSGSAFYPDDGQTGPWTLSSFGYSDRVSGIGLINRWHISIFVTYVLMTWEEYQALFLVPQFDTMREKVMFYGDKVQKLSLNPFASLNREMVKGISVKTEPVFSPVTNEYKIAWGGRNYVCQKADPITLKNDGRFPNPRYYYAPVIDVNEVSYFEGER